MAVNAQDQPAQAVRFSDVTQEIEPDQAAHHASALTADDEKPSKEQLCPEAEKEIRNLSMTLHKSTCQAKRMEHFNYEPVSLPPSRVSRQIRP
jgi:hypothetical protein